MSAVRQEKSRQHYQDCINIREDIIATNYLKIEEDIYNGIVKYLQEFYVKQLIIFKNHTGIVAMSIIIKIVYMAAAYRLLI